MGRCVTARATGCIRPAGRTGSLPGPSRARSSARAGRMASDYRNNFHLCMDCLQAPVLKSYLSPDARALALESKARWEASQKLLDQAEAVVRAGIA